MTTRIPTLLALAIGLALSSHAMAGHDGGDKFKMMDTNGDGAISADEHTAGATAMFAKLDANADGNVTAVEMDAGGKREGMSSADKIKAIDTNGDGQLSAAEHAAGSSAMFAQSDADKDGKVTSAEMQAHHAAKMGDKKVGDNKTP